MFAMLLRRLCAVIALLAAPVAVDCADAQEREIGGVGRRKHPVNLETLPEAAQEAIAELNATRVRVFMRSFAGDARERDKRPHLSIRFTTYERPGFAADSSAMALGKLLGTVQNVIEIDLAGTNVRDHHLALLFNIRTLRELKLNSASEITDDGLASLKGLPGLTVLWLDYNRQIGDSGVERLSGLANMVDLGLTATAITDVGMTSLRGMERLERLGLAWTRITGAGLENVAAMARLRDLDLRGTKVGNLDGLAGLLSLEDLELSNTSVGDADLAHLACLSNMVALGLSDTRTGDAGLAHLNQMNKLKRLYLKRSDVGDRGLKNIAGMQHLELLDLSETDVTDAGLAHLRALPLEWLRLDETGVSDAGMQHLRHLTRLRHLSAHDTKVTEDGVAPLRGLSARGETTELLVGPRDPVANNPLSVEPVAAANVARVKGLLSWLPPDTEVLGVAHGPFAFNSPSKEAQSASSVTLFEDWVRPRIDGSPLDCTVLQQVPVALVVYASRPGVAGCDIVVFERALGEAGDSFTESIGKGAIAIEEISGTRVLQVATEGGDNGARFVAAPARDILLFADSRDYLAKVLERMKSKARRRALPEELPEWKHLDLGARQWAMRHYSDPDFGVVYRLQPGDVARVLYVGGDADSVTARPGGRMAIIEPNVVEASYDVRTQSELMRFFGSLFCELE